MASGQCPIFAMASPEIGREKRRDGLPVPRPCATRHTILRQNVNNRIKTKAHKGQKNPLWPQKIARMGPKPQKPLGQEMARHIAKGPARQPRTHGLRQPPLIGRRPRQRSHQTVARAPERVLDRSRRPLRRQRSRNLRRPCRRRCRPSPCSSRTRWTGTPSTSSCSA